MKVTGLQSLWDSPKLKTTKDKNQKPEKFFHYRASWSTFVQQSQQVSWVGKNPSLRQNKWTVEEAFNRGGGNKERPRDLETQQSRVSQTAGWIKQVYTLYGKLLKTASFHLRFLSISDREIHVLWDSQNYKIP